MISKILLSYTDIFYHRYEYQINFLQERLRRLSRNGGISSKTSVPGPAPTVISHISEEPEAHDVNEQFLSLLDMDAAGKYKEMEEKGEK